MTNVHNTPYTLILYYLCYICYNVKEPKPNRCNNRLSDIGHNLNLVHSCFLCDICKTFLLGVSFLPVSKAQSDILCEDVRTPLLPGGSQRWSHEDLDGCHCHSNRRAQSLLTSTLWAMIGATDLATHCIQLFTISKGTVCLFYPENVWKNWACLENLH